MQLDRVQTNEDSRLRILTEISQQITSIQDINELLNVVVRFIRLTFNYYHMGIGLVEANEMGYRVGAGECWDDPGFQFKLQCLKVGVEGITGWVAYTGKPVLEPDVRCDPRYVWMQGSLTQSELTVPFTVNGEIIGVLDMQSLHAEDFDQHDLELMQAIANQAGIPIENARLFAATQQRTDELGIINSVQEGLASKLDMQSSYELVGDPFHKFFKTQAKEGEND